MNLQNRYSVILGNLGNTCDRFLPTGYKSAVPKEEMICQAASISGIGGLELVGTWDVTESNIISMRDLMADNGLQCVSIIPDLFSQQRWGRGSLSAIDSEIRRQAMTEVQVACHNARELECSLINLWLGQDGYDYPLSSNFRDQRKWLLESICSIASEFPDLRFALEYKPKEPRNFSFHARAGDTLLMAQETGLSNVGICIDVGHAFMAGENVSESAFLAQHYGQRLFHMHFNDNYRTWDDDMIVGSLHIIEYFELLFWLREIRYDGWYSMDQYPYREDGVAAVRESVSFLRSVEMLLTPERITELRELIAKGDATASNRWMRECLLGTINDESAAKGSLKRAYTNL